MGRNYYSAGKRQREREKLRKKQEKARVRDSRRASGGSEIEVVNVEDIQGGKMLTPAEVLASLTQNAGSGSAEPIPVRLFVGGLNWRITTERLREQFEEVGAVKDAVVVMDRQTGDSRGFGFITMADRKDARQVIQAMNGKELDGRTLVVRQATERR